MDELLLARIAKAMGISPSRLRWDLFIELWRLIGLWENHPPHVRAMVMKVVSPER